MNICNRIIGKGQMDPRGIFRALTDAEKDAEEIMDKLGSSHVIYGMTMYDKHENLRALHIYAWPLTDDEFRKVTKGVHNAVIYALHRRDWNVLGRTAF